MGLMRISEPVKVGVAFGSNTKEAIPKWVIWKNKSYQINKVGLHHTYRVGRTLFHVFSVSGETLFFRLVLNTQSLIWNLEEINDYG